MRVGILANIHKPRTKDLVLDLVKFLKDRGHHPLLDGDLADLVGHSELIKAPGPFRRESELVVAIGGDGTILTAARKVGVQDVPILGVNLGTLGFLAEIVPQHLFTAMERILSGSYQVEERVLVKARIEERGKWRYALNDMVIDKGGISRVIELHVWVGDHFVGSYKADGLIISTPTGSTAYSLSAGGPIVNPKMKALIATPICPHSLAVRPLIIGQDEILKIQMYSDHEMVTLNVDGQVSHGLRSGDMITATMAKRTLKLVRVDSQSFYEILRTKLKWGIKPAIEDS